MTRRDPRCLTEMDLHMYVVGLLSTAKAHGVEWRHVPNGELRDKATGAKLKRMGVWPGSLDFDIFIPNMRPCFLEVKGNGGKLSPEQKDFIARMTAMGCGCGWARTPEQALKLLVEWGAVRTSSGSIHSIGKRNKAEGA